MYVLINQPVTIAGYAYSAGQLAELPRELVDPMVMTRLGANLTTQQQAAIVPWSAVAPGWPTVINAE